MNSNVTIINWKNNDSINLAFQIISRKSKNQISSLNQENPNKIDDSLNNIKKNDKLKAISKNLKNLII